MPIIHGHLVDLGQMRHFGHQRRTQHSKAVVGQFSTQLSRKRTQDRPVFLGLARRKTSAHRKLWAPFGIDEQPLLFRVCSSRQNDISTVRTAIAVATLINNEGTSVDIDLIRAKVVNHLSVFSRHLNAAIRGATCIHRANAASGRVQHQHLAARFFSNLHGARQNRFAVCLLQSALTNDHQIKALRVAQSRAVGAQMRMLVGQIGWHADQRNIRAARPGLAQTRVQHRCLNGRVRADQQHILRRFDIFNAGVAHIARTIASWQARLIRAALDIAALPLDQLLQRESRFDRHQITNQTRKLFALHRCRSRAKRLIPARCTQLAVLADIRTVKPLTAQTIPDKPCFVGNPFLVHAIMIARQHAHDFAPLGIHANGRPKRIHHINGFGLGQFPWTRRERVGFGHQRANRAQINDVALQVAVQRFAKIGGDLTILAAPGLAHLRDACHLGREAHAARARNAARHVGLDQRPQI